MQISLVTPHLFSWYRRLKMKNIEVTWHDFKTVVQRFREVVDAKKPSTPFMAFGDRIEIEMFAKDGNSIFGKIDQIAKQYHPPR